MLHLTMEGMPASVDGINIGASVSNPGGSLDKTIIDLSEFRLSMAGNPFKAALYASTPISDLNFKATADGTVHLGKIKDIYPLGDFYNPEWYRYRRFAICRPYVRY